jgi:hypothetical protein
VLLDLLWTVGDIVPAGSPLVRVAREPEGLPHADVGSASSSGRIVRGASLPLLAGSAAAAQYATTPRHARMHFQQRLIQPAPPVTVARRMDQSASGLSSRRSSKHGDYLAIT